MFIKDLIDSNSEIFLKKFINAELGGWPIISSFTNNPQSTTGSRLTSLQLMTLLSEYKIQPLLLVFVANHPKNTNERVIRVS